MDDELTFHLAEKIDALQRDGLSPDGARIEALRQFGDLTTARSRLVTEGWRGERYAKWHRILDDLARDSKHAWRSLWRTPGFTLAAILVLGLGVGASTAIFSVVNAVLLRPIPFSDPDTLVAIENTNNGVPFGPWTSEAAFNLWRSQTDVFSDVAALSRSRAS